MEITLNTIMDFGKYKGIKVSELLPENPNPHCSSELRKHINYFAWIQRETQHSLHKEVSTRIKDIHNIIHIHTPYPSKSYNSSRGDYGQSSCPGDYMGMGPGDFGIPNC